MLLSDNRDTSSAEPAVLCPKSDFDIYLSEISDTLQAVFKAQRRDRSCYSVNSDIDWLYNPLFCMDSLNKNDYIIKELAQRSY